MTDTRSNRPEFEALESVLDTYGADRTRWPAKVRLQYARLLTESDEAASLVREAEAFDRLLSMAPQLTDGRRSALVSKIVAAAAAEPQQTSKVIKFEPPRRFKRYGVAAEAAMLLAASLVLGMFVGTSGVMAPAVEEIASVAGLADTSDSSFDFDGEQISTIMVEDVI